MLNVERVLAVKLLLSLYVDDQIPECECEYEKAPDMKEKSLAARAIVMWPC
jgi:hypothetical protein